MSRILRERPAGTLNDEELEAALDDIWRRIIMMHREMIIEAYLSSRDENPPEMPLNQPDHNDDR